ncbi:hypothetical protein JTE90_007001 [Oedothorax gibbosus]|uniref:Uncharacterized protein n=1 Tax=Oedothorax gibbosus TaxID=931172 RepID=A0AAV6TXF4_9ARAC|nr:hypothetical protein JTE90_007001 [Oedothorax gibbosus]
MLLPNSKTICKHGRVLEVVEYQGNVTHCCEKECIPIPDRVIRGLACSKCKAVNYCKCKCISWEATKRKYLRVPLIKPEEGWQAVRLNTEIESIANAVESSPESLTNDLNDLTESSEDFLIYFD